MECGIRDVDCDAAEKSAESVVGQQSAADVWPYEVSPTDGEMAFASEPSRPAVGPAPPVDSPTLRPRAVVGGVGLQSSPHSTPQRGTGRQ